MIKIVLINHTFQKERFYKRWLMFAEKYQDIDVTLLAPSEWTWGDQPTLTFGEEIKEHGSAVDKKNFHIRLIDMKKHQYRSYSSKMMKQVLCDISPDIIYFIGVHTYETIQDIISIRNQKLPNSKLIVFSMRGKYHTLHIKPGKNPIKQFLRAGYYLYSKKKIHRLNQNCDAIFCHYPEGMSEFRKEGYKGPIYMQTQVGVDMDYFHYDEDARKRIRQKYNIGDAYCFGSASRFNYSKGLFDIIAALPEHGNWKFMMMGSGLPSENEAIKNAIAERGLENKIILTGFLQLEEMADHWNALDCAVHVPKTTDEWEETFSLALVQAMATGLPVIGSSSGSVPYQIGPEGVIVEEGNIDMLRDRFEFFMNNPQEGKKIGAAMYRRASECFSITHLNDCFYDTIIDIYNGNYDKNKIDMAKYRARGIE